MVTNLPVQKKWGEREFLNQLSDYQQAPVNMVMNIRDP
jgi:hypothetical protein